MKFSYIHIAGVIKSHFVALILSLAIALFMVSPELIMRESLSDAFRGVYMHGSDGELFYLARMQQTYRDISAWDSPFLYEYRGDFPLAYALFAEPVFAYPGKWLGISVPELNLIYKTLFSASIFLLIYFLAFKLTNSKWWSVAVTILIMMGYRLITLPGMLDLLTWRQNNSQFLLFSRPPTSQTTWLVFWSFLNLSLLALRKQEWKYFVGCGIIFGLSFYSQFFVWTFLLAFVGTFLLIAILTKQIKSIIRIAVVVGIGFLIALPYILNTLALVSHSYFDFYGHMTLLVQSRELYISKIGLAVAVLFVFYLLKIKRKDIRNDMFMLVLLATTFITTNQQIITNRLLEVGHYHWFFNIFVYILIIFYLARNVFSEVDKKWIKPVLVLVVAISISNGYLIQSSSYVAQSVRVLSDQRFEPIFRWLNENTSPDNVILSNNDHLSLLLSVYTDDFVYFSSAAPLYMMPPERFETALFMYLKLNNIKPLMLGGESFFHPDASREQLEFASKYSDVSSLLHIQFRQAFSDGMFARYSSFYEQKWEDNFKKFRIDFVAHDSTVSSTWDLKKIKFLKPLKEYGGVSIYENILY